MIAAAVAVGVVAVGVSAVLLADRNRIVDGESSAGTSMASPAPAIATAPAGGYAANESAAAPSSGSAADASSSGTDGRQSKSAPIGSIQRDLIRNAQLTLDVDDAAARGRQVRTAATAVGGQVVQEQSGDQYSYLTLRVPSDSLDALTDDVAALGKVTGRTAQVTDATEDVVDLDARVRSQQASVDRVRALLSQAQSIGDIVSIESELASREADLDSLTSRLASLRDQVAMSTLTVDLRGPQAPPVAVDGVPGPTGFTEGLAAGWSGLLAVGTAAAAVVGFLLPMLPLVAVVLGVVWLVRRMVRVRRPATPATAGPGAAGPGAPAPGPTS